MSRAEPPEPRWAIRAAERLYEALDRLEGEAMHAGQVEQSPEAERAAWVGEATRIIGAAFRGRNREYIDPD